MAGKRQGQREEEGAEDVEVEEEEEGEGEGAEDGGDSAEEGNVTQQEQLQPKAKRMRVKRGSSVGIGQRIAAAKYRLERLELRLDARKAKTGYAATAGKRQAEVEQVEGLMAAQRRVIESLEKEKEQVEVKERLDAVAAEAKAKSRLVDAEAKAEYTAAAMCLMVSCKVKHVCVCVCLCVLCACCVCVRAHFRLRVCVCVAQVKHDKRFNGKKERSDDVWDDVHREYLEGMEGEGFPEGDKAISKEGLRARYDKELAWYRDYCKKYHARVQSGAPRCDLDALPRRHVGRAR